MTVLTQRSASQIQRTFLPGQTADVGGRIYRVEGWPGARSLPIDVDAVRRRLLREIRPFEAAGGDSGLGSDLRRGMSLEVVEVDTESGVLVEMYPQIWLCRACKRIGRRRDQACRCGANQWGQFHFLGVHSCGNVVEPFIRRCPAHDDVAVISPRSAKASDIVFRCPECRQELAKGLGFVRCSACGQGSIAWNVHKARPVFTPREMVMINPARPERAAALKAAGGERRALDWVLEGMSARRPEEHRAAPGRTEFIANLVAQGFSQTLAESLADQAGAELRKGADDVGSRVDATQLSEAEHDAFDIAMALAESRLSTTELERTALGNDQARMYREVYPESMRNAGIFGIDLVDRFPVMSVTYGYTRGVGEASELTLRPFRGRNTTYRFHGQLSETEAFFVRLDPVQVLRWLKGRGHDLGVKPGADARSIRIALLQQATIPEPGVSRQVADPLGWDVVTLVHSFAHRFIRQASVLAGIDRDALSEYMVPNHLGFFVFAAARGNFVLGGLQAVLEHDLHVMLDTVVNAEHRCPLDPGCAAGGGACPACLHLGEPSCRRFNVDLDRHVLFGTEGYFSQAA
jgi:hypothetical protein